MDLFLNIFFPPSDGREKDVNESVISKIKINLSCSKFKIHFVIFVKFSKTYYKVKSKIYLLIFILKESIF